MLKIFLALLLVSGLITTSYAYVWAMPSVGFHEKNGEIFDDWQVCRTRPFGDDGFYQVSQKSYRPVIAFESLGENTDLAYNLGKEFTYKYPNEMERAEEIYYFARDRVQYTPDVDQFQRDEFAQNADELATTINENGIGYGDCEDSAILLAIMYKGAGYRSAIALTPGHTAALLFLPEYKKTASVLELGGESGWIWAEATGKNNPLGWIPKQLINKQMAAYEISVEEVTLKPPIKAPLVATIGGGGGSSSVPFPFFSIIVLFWLIPMFRRKR